jgi:hypothetical protein
LLIWFSHLRLHISGRCRTQISIKSMVRSIESGIFPNLSDVGEFDPILSFLNYFGSGTDRFAPSELAWLFACLIFVDRLVSDDLAGALERIIARVAREINDESPFIAYEMVCFVILTNFFHRPD